MNIEKCHNQSELRKAAKRRLPSPIFNYLDGGSDDEWSLQRNTLAFNDYELLPHYLRNVDQVDLKTRVLGTTLDLPLLLAPTGMSRLFHHDREIAVAKAARNYGTLYSLSTLGTASIEEIARVSTGPKLFQIYIMKDRELTREFLQRCKDSDFAVMCLTVDTPLAGNRERDLISGFTMPPRFSLQSLWSFAAHPYWTLHLLSNSDFELKNVVHRVDKLGKHGTMSLITYVNEQLDRTVTWEDAAWLAEQWDGPFVIKGLQTPEDAKRAVEVGANACSIGRDYLYGLSAGGQRGVERSLELYRSELLRDMALLGCTRIADIDSECIRHRPDDRHFHSRRS